MMPQCRRSAAIGVAECYSSAWGPGSVRRMIVDGIVQPMELGHLPYKKRTYEDYVGLRGLEEFGKKAWRKHVEEVVESLTAALEPDDVVLGGGNAKKLKEMPPLCRLGDNADAFKGGFRMWDEHAVRTMRPARASRPSRLRSSFRKRT